MTDAYFYVKAKGINSAASYPYVAKKGSCKYNALKIAARCTGYVSIQSGNETALQMAVDKGPVSVIIDATDIWRYNSTSGIYDSPKCGTTPNHPGEFSLINFF
jgi:cathepsin L